MIIVPLTNHTRLQSWCVDLKIKQENGDGIFLKGYEQAHRCELVSGYGMSSAKCLQINE
jgi:hypothetical protein